MHHKSIKRYILGSILLAVAVPGGYAYRQYRQDMSQAYQRVASGGRLIETACGPIQYSEFGQGEPAV